MWITIDSIFENKTAGMRVGIGMISRGEVGLIVAGVGLSSGVLTEMFTQPLFLW